MATRIRIEPIIPKKLFDVPAGQVAKEKALESLAQKAKVKLEKPVADFDEPVEFTVKVTRNGITITTTSRVYKFLNEGTRVRYATMSKNFSPKTRVGSFSSSRGRGGLLFVNRNKPMPGIVARGWTPIVQKEIQAEFPREFKSVIAAYVSGEAPGL